MEYPINLYYENDVKIIKELDLCRGEDDYRKVYIVDDGHKKIVIKHLSNNFSDNRRINGSFRLMDEYRKLGIYCPSIIKNRDGELLNCKTIDNRDYYTYAEEFAIYAIAENVESSKLKDEKDFECYIPELLRSLGKVASAKLDTVDWPSAYCLLEPFGDPDTTDEGTWHAIDFVKSIKENYPQHLPRAEFLLDLFYKRQEELRMIYYTLPTSCFQADLNDSNILLNSDNNFVGLIDFNLCGREPILNYTVREAMWQCSDNRLYSDLGSKLYHFDKDLDDLRIELFLKNISYIQETYEYTEEERRAFPILFRYMNSFWYFQLHELNLIKKNGEDDEKVIKLFDWLEYQMNRDDIRLP